ncbi:hypothetical protein D3C80_765320 [compost metagenome]
MLYPFVFTHVFIPKPVPTFGRHALTLGSAAAGKENHRNDGEPRQDQTNTGTEAIGVEH